MSDWFGMVNWWFGVVCGVLRWIGVFWVVSTDPIFTSKDRSWERMN